MKSRLFEEILTAWKGLSPAGRKRFLEGNVRRALLRCRPKLDLQAFNLSQIVQLWADVSELLELMPHAPILTTVGYSKFKSFL